ncbi:hypothetical protein DL769_007601 [Monosporascus sp. CRB-8-3]|nr:hypothetical protein DL769_007601 [Monosporascus sp. CRB-8-3]
MSEEGNGPVHGTARNNAPSLRCITTTSKKVVTRGEWLEARTSLLVKEKEVTHANEKLFAQLRDFPMVKVDKEYIFHNSDGQKVTLADLFKGKKQLIVYHFMFAPEADVGCRGCSFMGENFPDVRHLETKDTAFTAVSRAPIEKIEAFKKKTGWKFPWVSSGGSDFNYDFHVTLDESVAPVEYNYKNKEELEKRGLAYHVNGEQPGLSVFYKEGDEVYHTYSTYSRGLERYLTTFNLLDVTPLGRQVGPNGPAEFKLSYEYEEK